MKQKAMFLVWEGGIPGDVQKASSGLLYIGPYLVMSNGSGSDLGNLCCWGLLYAEHGPNPLS